MRDARSFFFWRVDYCILNDDCCEPNASHWYFNASMW
jgi:hypothetical protein